MNRHLRQRVADLFNAYDVVMLVTCGQAGPQISQVAYKPDGDLLNLFVPHNADHLFNLESQSEVVLLSQGWKLQGTAIIANASGVTAPYEWQKVVIVTPIRLHVLADDGQNTIESIDF